MIRINFEKLNNNNVALTEIQLRSLIKEFLKNNASFVYKDSLYAYREDLEGYLCFTNGQSNEPISHATVYTDETIVNTIILQNDTLKDLIAVNYEIEFTVKEVK